MRKILILFLLAGAMAACNNDRMKNNRDNTDRTDSRDRNTDRTTDRTTDDRNTSDNTNDRSDANGYNDKNDRSSNDGWSRSDEDQFMGDCERTARKNVSAERPNEYCDCMMKKIEKVYSTLDDANRKMTEADMQPLADDCNGK